MPLSISLGNGNEHGSKRFNELLEGLDKIPKELYADSSYDNKEIRNKLSIMNIIPTKKHDIPV